MSNLLINKKLVSWYLDVITMSVNTSETSHNMCRYSDFVFVSCKTVGYLKVAKRLLNGRSAVTSSFFKGCKIVKPLGQSRATHSQVIIVLIIMLSLNFDVSSPHQVAWEALHCTLIRWIWDWHVLVRFEILLLKSFPTTFHIA